MPAEPVTLTAHFQDFTGIIEAHERSLRVFPNPATNLLRIEFNNPYVHEVSIQLMNIQGQIVAHKIVAEQGMIKQRFDLSGLPPGIYMLIIRSDLWNTARKVVMSCAETY
mgnify:CR=1 FL=1